MNTGVFILRDQQNIAKDTFQMELSGDVSQMTTPGTFVNIRVRGHYLRRPISICRVEDGHLYLTYKVVGEGTKTLSTARRGMRYNILGPLGNGFTIRDDVKAPLLIGGGIGVPPLLGLCEALTEQGIYPGVILGFGDREEMIYARQMSAMGADVFVSTVDGSYGLKGFVTDVPAIKNPRYDYFYACGPLPMLRALENTMTIPGQLSYEERMACGFGACMGCSCKTKSGNARICTEGPVFEKGELLQEGGGEND